MFKEITTTIRRQLSDVFQEETIGKVFGLFQNKQSSESAKRIEELHQEATTLSTKPDTFDTADRSEKSQFDDSSTL